MMLKTKKLNFQVHHRGKFLIMALYIWAVTLATADEAAPHCSSTFHVWQPGQEAQQMIREMYLKMDNLTSYTKFEVAEVRAYVSQEMTKIQNWTYAVDKRVFQLQIDKMDEELIQMKFSAGSSKLQMQLEHIGRRVDDLERSMYSIRSKLRSGRSSNVDDSRSHHDSLPQQQGLSADLGAMLKNSVGDLKAEWLLLKRDVEQLKKESLKHTESQQEIRNDTASLKVSLDETTRETKLLEIKAYEIADKQERLEMKMEKVLADTERMSLLLDQYRATVIQYGTNVASLQSTSTALQNEMNDVHIKIASLEGTTGHQRQRIHEKTHDQNVVIPQRIMEHSGSMERSLPENSKERAHTDTSEQFRSNFWERPSTEIPRDCHDVYLAGFRVSSVYYIQPDNGRYMVPVYCEMINNTGYTVIQRRIDGTISFNKRWSEYQQGFGNPYGELWAGNELIHILTKQKQYTLRIDLWDWEGDQFYAEYGRFYVEGANEQYKLTIGEYSGNAGDSFVYHNKMAFSTEDMDNDLHERHCAAENKAGWWYNSCFYSQLNGIYHTAWYSQTQSNYADGIVWFTLKDSEFYSLKKVEMKLKANKASG